MNTSDFTTAFPEIFLVLGAIFVLMFGTFFNKPVICSVLSLALVIATFVLLFTGNTAPTPIFNNLFVHDNLGTYFKGLILISVFFSIFISLNYTKKLKLFEYPVLILLCTVGMMLMVSANNFMSLYLALELHSLPMYILVSLERKNVKSSEAGMKYFILGAIASGILLYGCSLIYGLTGTLDFTVLHSTLETSTGVLIGMILVVSGVAFKLSAAPFHMWTPDVYEGSPTPITTFLAIAPKIAVVGLLVRVLFTPFFAMKTDWQTLVAFLSVASMAVGAFGALRQTNIKRLLAYSTIGNMGYVLLALASGSVAGIKGAFIFLAIYIVGNLGAFAGVLLMRRGGKEVGNINDLAGLSKYNPVWAFAMAIIMFSLAAVPPFAGFFGKLYVFLPAIESGLFGVAVFGVIMSVVSAFYYLRVIKIMYIDVSDEPLDTPYSAQIYYTVLVSSVALLAFVLHPSCLLKIAELAVAGFGG